ncbi:MAG: phosphoribosylformylglycinamidine synthase I [Nitrososphaerales archaeon]|jgi:phosphoribosylformylglycinamidine synthase
MIRVAVVRFPGSNCDLDAVSAIAGIEGLAPELVWHESPELGRFDAVVLPGGFSFGDYLRAGSIAASSPAIASIRRMAESGTPVLGVCNGFQILVEAGLLPGALLRNSSLSFVCEWVCVRVESSGTPFTRLVRKGQVLRMPIAHGEGRYYLPEPEMGALERRRGVVFRYCDPAGRAVERANPTGTSRSVAGVSNERGNVVGLMPHPERGCDPLLSPWRSADGRLIFASLLEAAM